jgi:hypothetical protein
VPSLTINEGGVLNLVNISGTFFIILFYFLASENYFYLILLLFLFTFSYFSVSPLSADAVSLPSGNGSINVVSSTLYLFGEMGGTCIIDKKNEQGGSEGGTEGERERGNYLTFRSTSSSTLFFRLEQREFLL